MLSLLLMLLSQITVSSSGFNVSDADVSRVMDSLTSWTGSLFDVVVKFVGVIIVIWVVKLVIGFIKKD